MQVYEMNKNEHKIFLFGRSKQAEDAGDTVATDSSFVGA